MADEDEILRCAQDDTVWQLRLMPLGRDQSFPYKWRQACKGTAGGHKGQSISKTRPSRFVILRSAQDDTLEAASFDSQNVFFEMDWPLPSWDHLLYEAFIDDFSCIF